MQFFYQPVTLGLTISISFTIAALVPIFLFTGIAVPFTIVVAIPIAASIGGLGFDRGGIIGFSLSLARHYTPEFLALL